MTATLGRTAILIWDNEGEPPEGDWTVLLWRSYSTGGGKDLISVPRLVEDNAESLRAKYLAWVYDLSQTEVNGTRLVDHLKIRPGFSYWWMTLIAQKCTYARSPNIYHAVRLLACEEILKSDFYKRVKIVTAELMLAREIDDWCASHGRDFEQVILPPKVTSKPFVSSLIERLPVALRGFSFMCKYLVHRLRFSPRVAPTRMAFDDGILFVDILVHFDAKAAWTGIFRSGYWANLVEWMHERGWPVNWAHFYYRHRATPNVAVAGAVVSVLNGCQKATGKHFLLDEHYGLGCFARTLVDFFVLFRKSLQIWRMPLCYPKGSRFTFQHLLQGDWMDSLVGKSAADNLCTLNAVEFFLGKIPRQRLAVYIQENQPWEMALLHAWHANGHGTIVGAPHTTIRFWDLRYFHDNRAFRPQVEGNGLPLPDKMALNGPAAFAAYQSGIGPVDRFVEVEAIRFIPARDRFMAANRDSQRTKSQEGPMTILVATDLLDTNTKTQLDWLAKAIGPTPDLYNIVIRPHPAADFCQSKFPDWQSHVDRSDLAELLARVDAVFVSNASSIAVDAYIAKKPVITVMDGTRFNFSPLRGFRGTKIVASAQELEAILRTLGESLGDQPVPYMCAEEGLSRWHNLLTEPAKQSG